MVMKKYYVILLMLLSVACIRETGVITETVIVNISGDSISFTAYTYYGDDITLKLANGEKAIEKRSGDTGDSEIFPITIADSVIIIFNKTRIAKYYANDITKDRSPFDLDSYLEETLGQKDYFDRYKFTYTITEEDYNNAIPIK